LERLLQYLDELDDLFGTIGLLTERLRSLAWLAGTISLLLVVASVGILLALNKPPLGLAIVILLFTALLYRAVTQPIAVRRQHNEAT
jgi:ABC-type Mn2+/Zn2+ transport system permease subunit